MIAALLKLVTLLSGLCAATHEPLNFITYPTALKKQQVDEALITTLITTRLGILTNHTQKKKIRITPTQQMECRETKFNKGKHYQGSVF
jgi:hypothetical protein